MPGEQEQFRIGQAHAEMAEAFYEAAFIKELPGFKAVGKQRIRGGHGADG